MDNQNNILEKENKRLKHKLEIAQKWMQSQVSWAKNTIQNKWGTRDGIEQKIYKFFPAESLSNFPNNGVENIISAEIIFEHLLSWEDFDGISVIISYGKILDQMVELYITKWLRKYISKNNTSPKYVNDPLEKSLRLIIEKKFTFSLGRLYQSLDIISKSKELTPYLYEFSKYIKSRAFLWEVLLSKSFLLQLKCVIDSHALTDKRHTGTLSKADTISARNAIIWDFKNKECILYLLSSSQKTDI